MVKIKFFKGSLPLALLISFSFALFSARFLGFSFIVSFAVFLVLLIVFSFLISFPLSLFSYDRRSILNAEVVEVENFLSIFSSYLKLGLSPELSLVNSCRQYSGSLKTLINGLVESSIYSGISASHSLSMLARKVKSRESRRLLQLFSHALNRNSEAFGSIAFKLLKNLRRNRILKNEVDLLFSKMKIRVSLLSLVFSAVLAMVARLFPIILLFMSSLRGGSLLAFNMQGALDDMSIFLALGILSFLNTYFVSMVVYHSHPLMLSFASYIVYILFYLLTPNLMRGT